MMMTMVIVIVRSFVYFTQQRILDSVVDTHNCCCSLPSSTWKRKC